MRSQLATCLWSLVLYFGLFLKSGYTQEDSHYDSCQTPEGEVASCIGIQQCPPFLDILKTLRRPYPPGVFKKLSAYKCNGIRKVCCPSGPIALDQETLYHNREEAPDVTNHKNFGLLPTKCGFLDSALQITNGEDAYLNEFPWMTLLEYKTSRGLAFLCGGTIINYNYILTSANCLALKGGELVSVRVGEYSIKNITDCEVQNNLKNTLKCNPPVQNLKVEEIIPHPQFTVKDKKVLNDIALLRVSRIEKAENVYPVCLPVGAIKDWPFRAVFVTGWGVTSSRTMEKADILKKVGLPVIDKRNCSAAYNESGIELTNTQICAGGVNGKASCSGDSGGPMLVPSVLNEDFIYVQHGIVSIGPKYCGVRGYPGVYTMVKFYMDWILDNMKP